MSSGAPLVGGSSRVVLFDFKLLSDLETRNPESFDKYYY